MSRRQPKTAIVVAVSDTHCNSTVGLLPPTVQFDDGSERTSGPEQRWLWDRWLELIAHIQELKRRHRGRVVVVFNGDGPDRNAYSGGYDLLTLSRSEIVRFTVEALMPMREIADVWISNRGTPAHEGGSGELCELVAERLNATKHERGSWSWWNTRLEVEGVDFFFGHRPISSSYREHTRNDGARRTAHDLWDAYHRMDDKCPDICVFSHVHHWEEASHNHELSVVYTPPWKLCDGWGHSVGFTSKTEPVGAWLFVCADGRYETELWQRLPPRAVARRI